MPSVTYTVQQLAGLLGVSEWSLYAAVRRGDSPVQPIRVGRRVLFARAAVERLLGMDADPEAEPLPGVGKPHGAD